MKEGSGLAKRFNLRLTYDNRIGITRLVIIYKTLQVSLRIGSNLKHQFIHGRNYIISIKSLLLYICLSRKLQYVKKLTL